VLPRNFLGSDVPENRREKLREIRERIEAMRLNGNPDWRIREILIEEKDYPEELVDKFGLEKNKTLSSVSGGPGRFLP